MKVFTLIAVGFLFLFTSFTLKPKTEYSTSPEKSYLIFTTKSTKEELGRIASEFATERNIDIDFSESEFSNSGRLLALKFKVNCKDGFQGSAIRPKAVFKKKSCGFLRNYKAKKDENAFKIGEISADIH